jgi:hypothetical protein
MLALVLYRGILVMVLRSLPNLNKSRLRLVGAGERRF